MIKYDELNAVMNYLALRDKCMYRGTEGYSTNFCIQVMPKLEELIHNDLTIGTELFDFWVEQTKHD